MMGLATIAGPFCFPVQAQERTGWVADTSQGRCALQFYRPAGEVLFELELDLEDRSYRVNGMILLGIGQADLRDLRIAAKIDDQALILSEAPGAFYRYLEQNDTGTPVGPFFDGLDDRKARLMLLETGSRVRRIPMDGYDQARGMLRECVTEYLTLTETNRRPRLVSFNGHKEVVIAARDAGLRWEDLSVTLKVDETGNPIKCAVTPEIENEKSRSALCRPLLSRSTFEPGHNEKAEPIIGRYENPIRAFMVMGTTGHLYEDARD